MAVARRLGMFFICDLQEKFRPAIYNFSQVIVTTQKILKVAKILNIPVFATTQSRAKLGETCKELGLDGESDDATKEGIKTVAHVDKTAFSMMVPELRKAFDALPSSSASNGSGGIDKKEVVIVGIESHICVTQTTLDLLREGHKVYILADGVSSCNTEEVPIALARLRAEGAVVTTSESWMYECMGDAGISEFRDIAKVVKEFNFKTKEVLQSLCKI
ncbi:hypothetical protein AAFC00_003994 [Neodothiora populina]|uniref:Isochorismatase-like domain-containing protein n=1 Tax=Neodothiora populina TaxID=2781224 RepID=A0ABR3PI66_9PEZI